MTIAIAAYSSDGPPSVSFEPSTPVEELFDLPSDPARANALQSRIVMTAAEECMNERGFDFVPDPRLYAEGDFSATSPYDDDLGWGVVGRTLDGLRLVLELELLDDEARSERIAELDPNRRSDMSNPDRVAWNNAFEGVVSAAMRN